MVLIVKLLGILFLSFNLFTIWKIYKANIYNKWWKYLLPVFINFPTFFADKNIGFDWKLLSFYFLGSDLMLGYQDFYSAAAIPIGSLYIWWKLRGWEVNKEFDQIGG
ncbi:MAG: hypothetical protein IPO45_04775 [Saprospiraceae bacterium]|jgi:hypothetical protein|uniref:hypothetical protein n=1 Tax=Candidatus Brachybacter algidus TaxID=2982024 RepID=UPI001B66233D|nr:hypothetical protein [Candidatus Brachybacter algidus]MBP7306181.1 hypothetical protein [Saprospiraceae bacterium]MBK6372086.1 hypothetical protein [Candidatus Brachybacter algidus]MBK6448590.1 hypothetical protein [Candidatus Brachybacter algidus]MBK7603500.1 hypothetical protein [Candidatus Brachybacter algidus]MBK8356913.1 hypothetical protein [Candidatus Brachybacter algidus]